METRGGSRPDVRVMGNSVAMLRSEPMLPQLCPKTAVQESKISMKPGTLLVPNGINSEQTGLLLRIAAY